MSVVEREQTTTMPAVLAPEVERGAALLDKRIPGWAEKVDLDNFDVQDSCRCVLAYNGGYAERLTEFRWGILDDLISEHGFSGKWHNQDWRLAILSRRSP